MSQAFESMISTTTMDGHSAPSSALAPKSSVSTSSSAVLDYPTQTPQNDVTFAISSSQIEDKTPDRTPPIQLAEGQKAAITAGWQANKKVLGLWSICSNQRNAYMYAEGLGWNKFADNSDSATMAFNIIAAHAKATGKGANFYQAEDGKVTTLYVW